MSYGRLEFRILGPLSVRVDGAEVPIGGPKQRALLALLLLNANRVVSRARLVDELFAEQSVNSADHALRNHVSRLRKVLAPVADEPRLVARAPGYLLRVESSELDLERFEALAADGEEALASGDATAAAAAFRAADALWHGRALADLELEPFLRVEADRLEDLRLAGVEHRIDAELALGRHGNVVVELETVCAEHPYRERFRAQLMLALYRCGRQAEGLEVYRRTRTLLNDELGLEPGVELQELERAILVQDPELETPTGNGRVPRAPASNVCPFKGLAPFERDDAEFFFGRERLVDELVGHLATAPLFAIIGPSGSGKSSLLRAGLLPTLARFDHLLVRPGETSAAELEAALAGAAPERFVLAVDQFEEVFAPSVPEHERRAFLGVLVDAAWDPDRRVAIVIALRADFFGSVAPYVELADLVGPNHVLLGPMSHAELRRAIEGPAARTGLAVEPELVDALVADVGGEAGGLPLLATTLLELWLEREADVLTLAAYERAGGVRGAVGRHAEAAFAVLNEDDREVARRIALRLVAVGETGALTRRRVTLDELDATENEATSRVLALLVERRLLVAGERSVELVHEALLDHWPRLARWLEDDAEGRRLHGQLTQAAAEWDAGGRDAGELYRGSRLVAALDWADANGSDAGLNQLERRFLAESRMAHTRENRRLRALLGVAVALLAVAVVAGAAALRARGTARNQAQAAVAQRLGAQALVEPRLDRSLLLAREGVALDDSAATQSNLLAALLRAPAALAVLHGTGARVLDDALTADGRILAVRSDDGGVTFFNTSTLRPSGPRFAGTGQISYFGAIVRPVRALAFSPDSSTIAVGESTGSNAELFLVDMPTHRVRATVTSTNAVTADVAYSPNGRTLVTGEAVSGRFSPPAEVLVRRRPTDGSAVRRSRPIPGGRLIGFARHGRQLLVTSGERKSLLLDARTFAVLGELPFSGAAALAPGGDEAAFGQDDGSVVLVDLRSGMRRPMSRRASGAVIGLAFSHGGRVLATTSSDGSVAIWDVPTANLREIFHGHVADAVGPAFSPDGATLYTGSSDGSAIVWDVQGNRRLAQPFRFAPKPLPGEGLQPAVKDASTALAVSPDGRFFATSPDPDTVTLWRAATQTIVGRLRERGIGPIALAWSHDGRLLAASGSKPTAVVWDVRTQRVVRVIGATRGAADGVAFSPNGRLLATAGVNGLLDVYDLRSGRRVASEALKGTLQDLDFSPDGKLLAAAGLVGDISIWDVGRRVLLRTIHHGDGMFTLRFSPDGTQLATGDVSGNVDFWDPSTGRASGSALGGQNGAVISVSFSPDGMKLSTTSTDGNVRLWDLRSRKLIGSPLSGSQTGGWGMFFADGRRVVTVFSSGAGVIWTVDPSGWKRQACRVAHRDLTRAEWHDFLPQTPYRRTCARR
jgi:WD40 repeat protein/DNA-binding SARP family transcriptional activator